MLEEERWSSFAAYCSSMKEDGEWAGKIELQAAAELMSISILVEQRHFPGQPILIKPITCPPMRTLHLLYDGAHYDAVIGKRTLRLLCDGEHRVVDVA